MVYKKKGCIIFIGRPIDHRNGQYVWIPWNILTSFRIIVTAWILPVYSNYILEDTFFYQWKSWPYSLLMMPRIMWCSNVTIHTTKYKKPTLLIQMYHGIYLSFVIVHSDVHPSYGMLERYELVTKMKSKYTKHHFLFLSWIWFPWV